MTDQSCFSPVDTPPKSGRKSNFWCIITHWVFVNILYLYEFYIHLTTRYQKQPQIIMNGSWSDHKRCAKFLRSKSALVHFSVLFLSTRFLPRKKSAENRPSFFDLIPMDFLFFFRPKWIFFRPKWIFFPAQNEIFRTGKFLFWAGKKITPVAQL